MPKGGKRKGAGNTSPYSHLPKKSQLFRLSEQLIAGLEAYMEDKNAVLPEGKKAISLNVVVEGALREFLYRYSDDSTDWLDPEREYWLERYMQDEPEHKKFLIKEKVERLVNPR